VKQPHAYAIFCFNAILPLMPNLKVLRMDYDTEIYLDGEPYDGQEHEKYLRHTYNHGELVYDQWLRFAFIEELNDEGHAIISKEWAHIVNIILGKRCAFKIHAETLYDVDHIGMLVGGPNFVLDDSIPTNERAASGLESRRQTLLNCHQAMEHSL